MTLGSRLAYLMAISAPLTLANGKLPLPAGAVPLSTDEIQCLFSNVRDDAQVQDSAGTTAVNYWYADGGFTNQWRNGQRSGEVTGRWRADKDRRCIIILEGLPERAGVETCSPLYREENRIYSVNADGSVHGIHTLSPLASEPDRDC